MDMYICSCCKDPKEEAEMAVKGGVSKRTGRPLLRSICRKCFNRRRDVARKQHKSLTRKVRLNRKRRAITVFKKYGLLPEHVELIYQMQGGRCVICGEVMESKGCIDHHHDEGYVRGLLCNGCNTGLGLFRENVEYLRNAIGYLKSEGNRELIYDTILKPAAPIREVPAGKTGGLVEIAAVA